MNRRLAVGAVLLLATVAAVLVVARTAGTSEPRIEIVGLDEWTREMIEDSLALYAPGVDLGSAACAVVLRDSLGFAQAAVSRRLTRLPLGRSLALVLVTVVEPQDSSRVDFAPAYPDSLPDRPEWAGLIARLRSGYGLFQTFQDHDFVRGRTDRPVGPEVPSEAVRLRDEVLRHASESDFEAAVRILETDRNRVNRTAAALVLGNFPDREETWRTYMEVLRRPPGHGTPAAEMMLRLLARNEPRPVDWSPAMGTLRALVDGTNLFAYPEVLEALVATDLDPRLGRELLRGGGHLPIAIMGADRHPDRPVVRRFLTHVAGRDLGGDPGAWESWIERL